MDDKTKKAKDIWDSKNCTRMNLKFNNRTDADILQALRDAPSKQGLIKDAIRYYLKHAENERT